MESLLFGTQFCPSFIKILKLIIKKTLDITLKDILKPILQVYTLTFSIFLRTFSVSLVKSDEPDEPYPSASVNRTSADQQVIPASLTT